MTDKCFDIIFQVAVAALIIFFCVMISLTVFEYRSPEPEPESEAVTTHQAWFAGFDSWLDSRLFFDLTRIFFEQNPKRSINYCGCLAAAAINQIHGTHTRYTEKIYKHNPITINKGIETLEETEKE